MLEHEQPKLPDPMRRKIIFGFPKKAIEVYIAWRIVQAELNNLAVLAATTLIDPRPVYAEGRQIVPVEYQRGYGLTDSDPWLPSNPNLEGAEATGRNEAGPWDKYDALDRIINGERARSVYWKPTRLWLDDAAKADLDKGEDAAASGFCLDAGSATYFGPPINGPITVEGIEFSEWDRLVIKTMRYSGFKRNLIPKEEIAVRVANNEPVIVDYSENFRQEWWGLVREVQEDGTLVITRYLKYADLKDGHGGVITITRTYDDVVKAKVLVEEVQEPGFEGNMMIVDRSVGGVILGTHRLG